MPRRFERFHQIGEMIDSHLLQNEPRAEYGREVIVRLAEDLRVANQRLYEMLHVFRAFPISRSTGKLPWNHYVLLSRVESTSLREAYMEQASIGSWSQRTLRDRLRAAQAEGSEGNWNGGQPPAPRRGRPYTYRVLATDENRVVLDLGMRVEHTLILDEPTSFSVDDVIQTSQDGEVFDVVAGEERHLYTFKADVTRVVDADTMWVMVDYGFRFRQPWKLRLRGIDAPELPTEERERAKLWVEKRLCEGATIVITTTKAGSLGGISQICSMGSRRMLGALRRGGKYLNAEMVEEGVAVGI